MLMLFSVQKAFEDYCLNTREETFFFSLRHRMKMSITATKEKYELGGNWALMQSVCSYRLQKYVNWKPNRY